MASRSRRSALSLGLLYCTHAALPLLLDAVSSSPRQVADLINISSVAGRVARSGSAVYNATKHAVGAFSEALRQEVTTRYLRVSLVEPGAVDTELAGHNRPEILAGLTERFAHQERMQASDMAEIISFIVTQAAPYRDQRGSGPAHSAGALSPRL